MKRVPVFLLAACCVAMASNIASAALFRDEMTSGAGWGMNVPAGFGKNDVAATFGYDYSADGIPEAPSSQGGDVATSGVKLEANNGDINDVDTWFTLYPIGQSFSGNTLLKFDAWMNYDAVERNEGGSAGTTEFLGGGIGHDSIADNVGSGAQAIATGDGGSGSDWRVFDPAFVAAADMVAGDRNGANAHYADFLSPVATPAAQGQVGTNPPQNSVAGSPAFQWITWNIGVSGDIVTIGIEKPSGGRLKIATWDRTVRGTTTDGNISIFYADFFSSVTSRPDLTFGIVDNVTVTVPEPATIASLGLAMVAWAAGRRRQ